MKLPRRGMLIDSQGNIAWSWEHNDPTTDFDMPPPHVQRLDGTMGPPTPDMIILDCDAELEPGDMDLIHANRLETFARKQNGVWGFSLRVAVTDAENKKIIVEIPHPIEAVRAARKAAKLPK